MTGQLQDVRVGTSITERLVTALSATWRAIQDRHPDVPDVVLTLGSGSIGARRGEVTLGHFAASRWHVTELGITVATDHTDHTDHTGEGDEQDHDEAAETGAGEQQPAPDLGIAELFVGGEGLRRGARDVLGTLLHEAAHGVGTTRRPARPRHRGRRRQR